MSEFNYTNRIEIPNDLIRIDDASTQAQNQLIVRSIDLSAYEFPEDALILLSAQRYYMYQRFDLGHPAEPATGTPVKLDFFESAGLADVTFRLLIVNANDKILGSSRPFKIPAVGRQVTPLLDMQVRDIGQEVWQLELDEESGPLLVVNSRIQDPQGVVDNPLFITYVLPMLVKQIAMWIMSTEIDDDPNSVPGKWIRYFTDMGVDVSYEPGRLYSDVLVLADDAARRFASGHELLGTYVRFAEGP